MAEVDPLIVEAEHQYRQPNSNDTTSNLIQLVDGFLYTDPICVIHLITIRINPREMGAWVCYCGAVGSNRGALNTSK